MRASARRYAEAAFQIGRDTGTLDAWQQDLRLISGVFQDQAVLRYFADPKLSQEAKAETARRMLSGRVQPHALNLVLLLVERGRVEIIPTMSERFEALLRAHLGIVIAEVTTAIPVDEQEQRRIGEQLSRITGKRVQLRMRVDPGIIGGLVARVGDRMIDGSVATSLQRLRERLT